MDHRKRLHGLIKDLRGKVHAIRCSTPSLIKLIKPTEVVAEFARLGYPESLVVGIGILELVCTVIYIVPRTSVLGAILLTGYLGGATATHVRVGDPFIPPVLGGALVWAGLYLRDARIRALIPLRSRAGQ